MSAQEELQRAADLARQRTAEARAALASTRAAVAGGEARNAKHAEEQLDALRASLGRDVTTLRDRAAAFDPRTGGTLPRAALVAAAGVALVIGVGVAASAAGTRQKRRRDIDRQAAALAQALLRAQTNSSASASTGRNRRSSGLGLLVTGAAVAAGLVVRNKRREAQVDDADLWLPERPAV
jgi:hypothetical protein